MKAYILSENIQKKISFLSHVISSRTQLPVLQNILIQAIDGKITLSATDLEIGIIIEIPANIEQEGATTVPAKIFLELVSYLPQEKITLELVQNSMVITSSKTKSSLQTINKEEFPKIYEDKGEEVIRVDTGLFKKNIASVLYAVSADAARPALSGVYWKKEDTGFLLAATDGYRLSLKHYAVEKQETVKTYDEKPLLIPGRVLRELINIKTEDKQTKVFISEKSNQIIFSHTSDLLIGRLIEAEFPSFERIIPADFTTRALFDKNDMLSAVKACSLFSRDTGNIIKLAVQKENIIVSANTPSVGENTVEIEARLTGEENEIAFNARYMLDFLSNVDAEDIIFEMMNPLSPGVFKVEKDPGFLHIIMPIRVQSQG